MICVYVCTCVYVCVCVCVCVCVINFFINKNYLFLVVMKQMNMSCVTSRYMYSTLKLEGREGEREWMRENVEFESGEEKSHGCRNGMG